MGISGTHKMQPGYLLFSEKKLKVTYCKLRMIKKFYFNKRTSQLTITDQKICISKYLQSSGQIWIKQNVNIN